MTAEDIIREKLKLFESEIKDIHDSVWVVSLWMNKDTTIIRVTKRGKDLEFNSWDEAFAYVDKRRGILWRKFR